MWTQFWKGNFYQKMGSYGSIVLPKNAFKNVFPTIESHFHIQNGRHMNRAESENAPYLSNQSSYENK